IHSHPELGCGEFKSSEYLAARLGAHGFRVEKPMKSLPTAFCASKKGGKPGPALGFISEYDALPEIGHGCGHNLIAASGFGAAVALAPFADSLGGSVWLFGTPAEESSSAKSSMVRAGIFDRLDAAIMMHPESMYMVNTLSLALDALRFRFTGRASHASSTPYEGINALDAMIQFFNGIGMLRQQLKSDARIHGIITKGGTFPNIIPDLTEAEFYVRAGQRDYLNAVSRKVKNCAKGAAAAAGCRVRISAFEPPVDNIINNPVLAGLVEKNLKGLGVRHIEPRDEVPGSSDFGNVSHCVPSLYFYCATAPKGSDLHTKEFARLSVRPLAHKNLIIAVKAMALTGLELLRHPVLLKQIRTSFRAAAKKQHI
ncbi:MAG: M20 family metallopeptidase, partial [bacterium]